MTMVHVPQPKHHCGPNRYGMWLIHTFTRAGTVVECACGRTWIAYRDRADAGYVGVKWRREGRYERWRRTRRAQVTPVEASQ